MTAKPVFAVLGAGNVGHAIAGYLAALGHDVRLYSRWERELAAAREAGRIQLYGAIQAVAQPRVLTTDIAEAVEGAEVIMVATTANGHTFISEALAPHLEPQQVVVFEGATLGTGLEFANILERAGRRGIVAAETESSLFSCRVEPGAQVNVRAVKGAVRLAALPASATARVVDLLAEPFKGGYVAASSVLEIGMANGNPVYHVGPSLLNLGSVERGEQMPYYHFMTEGVVRVLDAVDRERLAVAGALGLRPSSFWDLLAQAYGVDSGSHVERIRAVYSRGKPTPTPANLDDRYYTEDVPFGLVPWASLGAELGVPTPTMDALIHVACAALGRDLRAEGRTAARLGLRGLSPDQIIARFTGGG